MGRCRARATVGTQMVLDIGPGSLDGRPNEPVALGDVLIFSATDWTNGRELWVSDGTAGGTQMLLDIKPGATSSGLFNLTRFGEHVYFTADDGVTGYELWRTDGTVSGTVLYRDLRVGLASSTPQFLTVTDDLLFFTASALGGPAELMAIDGSSNAAINTGVVATQLTASGNRVFFSSYYFATGQELWVSDGTVVGTHEVADIRPGNLSSSPQGLIDAGTGVFFYAYGTFFGELWYSDGTVAGTFHVCTPDPGGNSGIEDLTMCAGHLFFTAYDPAFGRELMWVDTPGASTTQLGDPGAPDFATLKVQNSAVPKLGTTIDLVSAGPTGHVGILLASEAMLPVSVPSIAGLIDGGCDWVGLQAGQALIITTAATPSLTWPFVIPNTAAFEGLLFHFQTLWWNVSGAPLLQLSNGLQTALGTAIAH